MRKALFASTLLATVFACTVTRAQAASAYASLSNPIYTCVPGDNSVALNGLLANGGVVQIAAGTCNLAHGLIMTVSGTILNGAGPGRTVLQAMRPEAIDVVTLGISAVNYQGSGFMVGNLTIDGALTGPAQVSPKRGRDIVIAGGVHADSVNSYGALLMNVETRNAVDGVTIHGSDVTATGLNSHHNRHSGFFVMGLAPIPAPYNIAHNVTLKSSQAAYNNLDNAVGLTWDDVDISRYTANVTIGGPNPGDGNTILFGDILLGCPPHKEGCQNPTGPFLVQGNVVTNTGAVQATGVRAFGHVTGVVFDHNTIEAAVVGVGVFGNISNTQVTNNVVTGPTAVGVTVSPLAGEGPGNQVTVSANTVTMAATNRPAFTVQTATNVTLTDNVGNGAPYDTRQAGQGLVMNGNH